MIIDWRGLYTTAPEPLYLWRRAQVAAFDAHVAAPSYPTISDYDITESIEGNQRRILRDGGADVRSFRRAFRSWSTTLGMQR